MLRVHTSVLSIKSDTRGGASANIEAQYRACWRPGGVSELFKDQLFDCYRVVRVELEWSCASIEDGPIFPLASASSASSGQVAV